MVFLFLAIRLPLYAYDVAEHLIPMGLGKTCHGYSRIVGCYMVKQVARSDLRRISAPEKQGLVDGGQMKRDDIDIFKDVTRTSSRTLFKGARYESRETVH